MTDEQYDEDAHAVPIHVAIARVMHDVRHVGKGDFNDFHKFRFRGIDLVLNSVGPALRRHGVIVFPELLDLASQGVATSGGKQTREVTLQVRYTFVGPLGDSLAATVPGEAQDSGDKAVSKAMSVAFRTALIQCLAIPTDEDDPDAASYERDDPLAAIRAKIWTEAQKRQWDMDALRDAFADWTSDDLALSEAPVVSLEAFYKHLVPPRTVQRARKRAEPAPTPPEPPLDGPEAGGAAYEPQPPAERVQTRPAEPSRPVEDVDLPPLPDEPPPDDEPPPADPEALKRRMFALFGEAGIIARTERIAFCQDATGDGTIISTNGLTDAQRRTICAALTDRLKGGK